MDVKAIQQKLNALGFNCGNVDGIIGPKTTQAIINFKSSIGRTQMTDEELYNALMNASVKNMGPNTKKLIRGISDTQFFHEKTNKKFIFLHHTCGYDAQSAIDWWNSKPDRIATPYVIERNGDIIEVFNPDFWAFALGVKGGTWIEKASIHIEIISFGEIEKDDEGFYFQIAKGARKTRIPKSEVMVFENGYRDNKYYHRYTQAQIDSLKQLIPYLMNRYNIPFQKKFMNFWNLQTSIPKNLEPGIWSHTSVRKDKSDIFPQGELIEMLYGLFSQTNKATLP